MACSDSRIDPVRIFNLSLGDAFVVRTAGNIVSSPPALESLEYAVSHLGVRCLVVLGHDDCGAVKCVISGDARNMTAIVHDIERARQKAPPGKQNDALAVAEANVRLQMRLLMDNSHVVRDAVRNGSLQLLGGMYEISSGSVRFL